MTQVKENILERKGFIQGLDNYGHPILLGRADMHFPKVGMVGDCCHGIGRGLAGKIAAWGWIGNG